MSRKRKKIYIVALTERYEVRVSAASRKAAMNGVDSFGGSSPKQTIITARLAKDQDKDADIEVPEAST